MGLDSSEMNLLYAKKLTFNGYYEDSDKLLVKYTKFSNDYHLCKMINAFQQNNKVLAEKHLKVLEDSFEPLPRRYESLIYLVRADIEHWKVEELDDIARDMKHSGSRLRIARGGKKTQGIQEEILRKLDKKIKNLQDKADGASGSGEDKKDEIGSSSKAIGQNQQKPAEDSGILSGDGTGKIDDKKLKTLADKWGTMPEKERAKAIHEITRDLPARYRVVIEDFFKALAKTEENKR